MRLIYIPCQLNPGGEERSPYLAWQPKMLAKSPPRLTEPCLFAVVSFFKPATVDSTHDSIQLWIVLRFADLLLAKSRPYGKARTVLSTATLNTHQASFINQRQSSSIKRRNLKIMWNIGEPIKSIKITAYISCL
jgi:hypothetical protein